jgi:hypothetical protein
VVARFDGGQISTEAGALLLRPVEQRMGILRQFAACFRDFRRADLMVRKADQPELRDFRKRGGEPGTSCPISAVSQLQ